MTLSFQDYERLLVAILITGFVMWHAARRVRNFPPIRRVTEQSGENMAEVERLKKRVDELEAEVRQLRIAFDAVMQDAATVRERNVRLEELVIRKDDQIKQLWLEIEDWRKKVRSG